MSSFSSPPSPNNVDSGNSDNDWTFLSPESLIRHKHRAKALFEHNRTLRENEYKKKRREEESEVESSQNTYDHEAFLRDIVQPFFSDWREAMISTNDNGGDKTTKSLAKSLLVDFALINKKVLPKLSCQDIRLINVFGSGSTTKKRTTKTSILSASFMQSYDDSGNSDDNNKNDDNDDNADMEIDDPSDNPTNNPTNGPLFVSSMFLSVATLVMEMYVGSESPPSLQDDDDNDEDGDASYNILHDKHVLLLLTSIFIDASSRLLACTKVSSEAS